MSACVVVGILNIVLKVNQLTQYFAIAMSANPLLAQINGLGFGCLKIISALQKVHHQHIHELVIQEKKLTISSAETVAQHYALK